MYSDIGIIGGNLGEIVFVNLRTGACLGSTCVKYSIKSLEILNECCSNSVWLIVSLFNFTLCSHNHFIKYIIINLLRLSVLMEIIGNYYLKV